ncbi:MAG TPA: M15 family metallopeptidase [Candidatus Saccharibacteria bacterium]|nr:M15 family metallopeptidase [Candidatus Saccharibacteria bacterium]HRQ06674.1 M15 family metallopeptidase [Candidatus Saccharibacteria bacterium]
MQVGRKTNNQTFGVILVFFVFIAMFSTVVTYQINQIIPKLGAFPIHPRIIITPKPFVPKFNSSKHFLTEADSLWVIVNKSHRLNPINYVPASLSNVHGGTVNTRMVADLDYMFAAAVRDGIYLTIASSYRSYGYQVGLYNNYSATYGQAMTDTFSARPGYSEHQTGLAIDFGSVNAPQCNIDECYAETTAGEWLANHGLDYGFLLRYPSDKQQITGYKFEPWHYRYIGHYLADEMKKQKITTLEEFFNLPGGQVYK